MDTEIKTHLERAVLGSFCLPPACCSKRGGRKKKKKDFHLSRKKGKKLKAKREAVWCSDGLSPCAANSAAAVVKTQ